MDLWIIQLHTSATDYNYQAVCFNKKVNLLRGKGELSAESQPDSIGLHIMFKTLFILQGLLKQVIQLIQIIHVGADVRICVLLWYYY